MTGYISSLDDRFLTFERAAKLMALERPDLKKKHALDSFKHALFAGDFESSKSLIESDDIDLNHLRILYPQPRAEISEEDFVPTARPFKYYGVGRWHIALILYYQEGLPEPLQDWENFLGPDSNPFQRPAMYRHLSNIPLKSYPKAGQKILGEICISKAKLRDWMLYQKFTLPSFLELRQIITPVKITAPSDLAFICTEAEPSPGKGRPRNPRWDYIQHLVNKIADSNPDMLHKNIAYEAHKLARQNYANEDLPSEKTILRRLNKLLK
ncbi:hypothetical protein [Emcibacter nanhaiensis]|uniref:Uncharacterized protein n=1 Tax=Emcibacter nanhaiensis TaxID=1505037 RepID=A0A501PRJ1_9PROT|nr:hypothetical protein [Emcibacter nanhaiensis]TPD62737.1 hypothetical protein FIV46_01270 [Emcibacter nanhaiensis]